MANIASAAKRARQVVQRTVDNHAKKSRIKTVRKRVLEAVASGDKVAAESKLVEFASAVDRAAKTNLVHKNAAARTKSHLAKLVEGMG
ncbi:MAG: 30S ribosomal protein S20 [Verrucomicrobiales bacterium]